MMRQIHSQLHSQKQSYKDLRYIVKPKEVYDNNDIFNTDEYEDEFSESYVESISNYEINYETYRCQGSSLKDAGSIIKTDKGYRFLFKNPKFDEIDQILKNYFFDFEEITPNKLKGILKKRKKNEKERLSLYIPGGNPSNYFIRLPNGDKLHFSWFFRSSGKDKDSTIRSCFRMLMGKFKYYKVELTEIKNFFSNKKNFENGLLAYARNCKEILLKNFEEDSLKELIDCVKKEIENEDKKRGNNE